jgi:hypothetical protein
MQGWKKFKLLTNRVETKEKHGRRRTRTYLALPLVTDGDGMVAGCAAGERRTGC